MPLRSAKRWLNVLPWPPLAVDGSTPHGRLGRAWLPSGCGRPPTQTGLGPEHSSQLEIEQDWSQLLGTQSQGFAELLKAGADPHCRQQATAGRTNPTLHQLLLPR